MRKTEFRGAYHTDLSLDIPDLPPEIEPYTLNFNLEAFSGIRAQIDARLEIARLNSLIEGHKKYNSKTARTRGLHRRMYKIMCNLEKIYRSDNLRKPSYQEHGENLANRGIFGYSGKPYAERVLREIKKLGNEGHL